MHTRQTHQFVMVLQKRDGSPLGQVPLAADWEPALEAARFQVVRRLPDAAIGANAVAEIRPAWHEELGRLTSAGWMWRSMFPAPARFHAGCRRASSNRSRAMPACLSLKKER